MSSTMNVTDIYKEGNISANRNMSMLNIPPPLNNAINIFTIIILFITMISLGCTMEISKIKSHLLKPKGVAIAMVTQFGIMPLTAFALAKSLKMDSVKAVTVLICGCCPGGNLSNIFTLALKGDMNLSIVMTTCSCIAALGLMPLLLLIYCQGFSGLENSVPYVGIISALTFTLVPCGMVWPEHPDHLQRHCVLFVWCGHQRRAVDDPDCRRYYRGVSDAPHRLHAGIRHLRRMQTQPKMQQDCLCGNRVSEHPAVCGHLESGLSSRGHRAHVPLPIALLHIPMCRGSSPDCVLQMLPNDQVTS
ncbi:hepatic sodium/bile acid cotransporter-like isoform X2 [Phyllopteryx taeniolatus]|uniref:hepatic sodium/bile acid cotransporter-like isoform X2 n=1 Tax=Phyllopteryx taeniolatus TaxID=161469 RepID=UPI002AD37F6F|nr:hepatic sodium/bile acid cotransporter-like isoform X2 [Phyllopteryx taeniolatus]